MKASASDKVFSVEEYIKYEWTAPFRSEFIDGKLFEMSGQKDINNEIAGNLLCILFSPLSEKKDYSVYAFDIKVKIFGENKYYYPEVFVTKEPDTERNKYIKYEPILIAEVVSEESHINDYVYKYIAYTKIPSLQYYLIIEPETFLIACYKRDENNNNKWIASKFTCLEDIVKLDVLNVSFQLKQVYS